MVCVEEGEVGAREVVLTEEGEVVLTLICTVVVIMRLGVGATVVDGIVGGVVVPRGVLSGTIVILIGKELSTPGPYPPIAKMDILFDGSLTAVQSVPARGRIAFERLEVEVESHTTTSPNTYT